jgi:GrpB-like predicted nucleotidyltransferase (UPF0157 family)
MKFEKYKFRKYDLDYSKLFQLEKAKLIKILGKSVDIAHIGSTAVKDLSGKGVIDILIGANKKNKNKIKSKLQENNYKVPIGGDKNRIFLEKDYKHKRKIRRVHLQLVLKNSSAWKTPLKAREILRKDKKLAKEYEEIKKKAVKKAKGKGKIYRDAKEKFLSKLK